VDAFKSPSLFSSAAAALFLSFIFFFCCTYNHSLSLPFIHPFRSSTMQHLACFNSLYQQPSSSSQSSAAADSFQQQRDRKVGILATIVCATLILYTSIQPDTSTKTKRLLLDGDGFFGEVRWSVKQEGWE
jgi:hypothetical protein